MISKNQMNSIVMDHVGPRLFECVCLREIPAARARRGYTFCSRTVGSEIPSLEYLSVNVCMRMNVCMRVKVCMHVRVCVNEIVRFYIYVIERERRGVRVFCICRSILYTCMSRLDLSWKHSR